MKYLLDLVVIVYGFFAVGVVIQLWRNGRQTFDDRFTPADRRLAGAASFYFAVPAAVGLHELGHAAAIRALGGEIATFDYFFYWGHVEPRAPFGSGDMALVALVGNLVSLAIAASVIGWTIARPINAAWNFARFELARVLLWLTLVLYPIGSLALGAGDFATLRTELNALQSFAGDLVILTWAGIGIAVWAKWNGPWRARYLRLASSIFDRRRAAERRVEQNPTDVPALQELGRLHLSADQPERAVGPLDEAAKHIPENPETRFLAGMAHLRAGDPRTASEHLRAAGTLIEEGESREQADLLFEITLALSAARLALADPAGALMTADVARAQRPLEPRIILIHADALLATGRGEEAKNRLEAVLETADGALASEIKRRLRAIGGSAET